MIDINELRQSLGAIQTEEVAELLGRLEAAESDALEQARLNGMGASREAAMIAKLEAAERSDAESVAMYRKARDERDTLRAKVSDLTINVEYLGNLKKSYEELIEELQGECDDLRAKIEATKEDRSRFLVEMGRLCAQCDALRAKIEAMEKQEPYAFAVNFPESSRVELVHDLDEAYEDMTYEAYEVRKLYLAPGAKGE